MAKPKITADSFSFGGSPAVPEAPVSPAAPAITPAMTGTVRKMVDPNLLLDNPLNRFSMIEDEDYEALVEGIKKDGFKPAMAIEVKPADENGCYVILSGHRRKKASLQLKVEKVPIVINNAAAGWSVIEEIGYLTRANDGARQKNVYAHAAMTKLLYEQLRAEGITENSKLIEAAMAAFGSKQTAQYHYSNLSTLPDTVIGWGKDNLLTRDEGLALAKVYETNTSKAEQTIAELETAYQSNSTEEDRRKAFFLIVGGSKPPKKGVPPKKAPAKIDTLKTLRKADKLLSITLSEDITIPRKEKNLQEIKELCDKLRTYIDKVEDLMQKKETSE